MSEDGFERMMNSYQKLSQDEFTRGMQLLADTMYTYFCALKERGFTEQQALLLVIQYQNALALRT